MVLALLQDDRQHLVVGSQLRLAELGAAMLVEGEILVRLLEPELSVGQELPQCGATGPPTSCEA